MAEGFGADAQVITCLEVGARAGAGERCRWSLGGTGLGGRRQAPHLLHTARSSWPCHAPAHALPPADAARPHPRQALRRGGGPPHEARVGRHPVRPRPGQRLPRVRAGVPLAPCCWWLQQVAATASVAAACKRHRSALPPANPPLASGTALPVSRDVKKHCADVTPGSARVIGCLHAAGSQLSPQCSHKLFEHDIRLAGGCRAGRRPGVDGSRAGRG